MKMGTVGSIILLPKGLIAEEIDLKVMWTQVETGSAVHLEVSFMHIKR
jgi:hypothetical protein